MARRTTPAAKKDDDAFPVRVKLAVPPDGLGRLADDIQRWLRANLEPGSFAKHSARTIGGNAVAIYFVSVEDALMFRKAFPEARLAIDQALDST